VRNIGLFVLVQLVLTPLPRVLAFEVPLIAHVPLAFFLQVAISPFATTIALLVVTQSLLTGRLEPPRSWPRAVGAASLSAALSIALALIPTIGLVSLLVLTVLLVGPPLVAQAIVVEDLSLRAAVARVVTLVRASPRAIAMLVGTGIVLGALSVVIPATAMFLVFEASAWGRTVVVSILQPAVLGCALAYLAALELVVYERALSPGSSEAATPG
jgi:hypothetical protein